ncbi:unnamed protein product [Agarophyton chilense]
MVKYSKSNKEKFCPIEIRPLKPHEKKLICEDRAAPESALTSALRMFSDRCDHQPSSLFQPILRYSRRENSDPTLLVTELANQFEIPLANLAMESANAEGEVSDILNRIMRRAETGTKTGAPLPSSKGSGAAVRIAIGVSDVHGEAPRFRTALDRMKILSAFLHACLTERALNRPVEFRRSYELFESNLAAGWILTQPASANLYSGAAVLSLSQQVETSVYDFHIENDTDQEVLDVLADDIFSKERMDSITSGTISVAEPPREADVVRTSINREDRDAFGLNFLQKQAQNGIICRQRRQGRRDRRKIELLLKI